MITGFNTDVKHGDRVFHVQTEDRGLENPVMESLVYVGGEIIASKKTPYADLLDGNGNNSKAIQELMESQHRKIIAAIQRGRFDGVGISPRPTPSLGVDALPPSPRVPAPGPGPEERTLDQVILDYLASEVSRESLDLTLYSSPDFYLGETTEIRLKAETSLSRRPVAAVAVLIKVISTVDKPLVLYQGKTASDGSCTVICKMPEYRAGNAAIIIQATSEAGNSEIKYLLRGKR